MITMFYTATMCFSILSFELSNNLYGKKKVKKNRRIKCDLSFQQIPLETIVAKRNDNEPISKLVLKVPFYFFLLKKMVFKNEEFSCEAFTLKKEF